MRKVNLFNYLPLFMQEYQEMNAILTVENEELTKEWGEIERAFNNTFIFSTDIYGISRFEKMMKIYPRASDTLKERQTKIYTKWNAVLPYTWKWLEEYLTAYFLGTSTQATPILFNKEYRLDVRLSSGKWFGEYEYSLFTELRELIPANLILNIVNVLPKLKGNMYCKSFLVYRMKKDLKSKAQDFTSTGNMYYKSGVVYRMKKEMKTNGI